MNACSRWALPSELEGYLAPKEDELPDHDDYLLEAHREAAQFHELGYYEAIWRDVCLARTLQKQYEANSQNSSAKKKASSVPRKRKVTRQSAAEPKDDRAKVPTSHEKFMSSLGSTKTEPDLYEDSEEDADTPGSEKSSKANPLQAIKPRYASKADLHSTLMIAVMASLGYVWVVIRLSSRASP